MKKIIFILVLCFIIGLLPKTVRYFANSQTKDIPFTAYYENVVFDNKIPDIQLSGELKPYFQAQIYSKIDGILKKRFAGLGDNVKKGDTLALVEAPVADYEKLSAEEVVKTNVSVLAEAEKKYNFAKDTYFRYKNAFKDEAVSLQDMQEKETNFKTAEYQYKIAAANLAKSKADLQRAVEIQKYEYIKAPFSGIITKYFADEGANIVAGGSSTGMMLFEIAQTDKLRLRIEIPQSYLSGIKLNQKINFFIPEQSQKVYTGTLKALAQSLNPVTRTMTAEIIADNKENLLYPGLYVTAILPLKKDNKMLLIKNSYIIEDKEGEKILTVDDFGALHYKKINRGKDFGDVSEVISGVNVNDKIVTNPNDNLVEGQMVKAVKSADN